MLDLTSEATGCDAGPLEFAELVQALKRGGQLQVAGSQDHIARGHRATPTIAEMRGLKSSHAIGAGLLAVASINANLF